MSFNNSNLYKFIASFGAVLLVLGLMFYYFSVEQNRAQQREMMRKIVTYSHERESYIGAIKAYDLAVADTASTVAPLLDEKEVSAYKNTIDLRTEQLNLEKQFIDGQVAYFDLLGKIIWGVCGAGLFLMVFGIILWAVKLQRHSDQLLRNQVRE